MYKLGQTDNATCHLCKGAEETAEHILCTCDAMSLKRLLGEANLTLEEVVSVAPRQVLNFFVESLELPQVTKSHIPVDIKVTVVK